MNLNKTKYHCIEKKDEIICWPASMYGREICAKPMVINPMELTVPNNYGQSIVTPKCPYSKYLDVGYPDIRNSCHNLRINMSYPQLQ